tara:strand:- start:6227 stop:8542 length:2316 start_codon:yes stop_codon:yes gene_type:complete
MSPLASDVSKCPYQSDEPPQIRDLATAQLYLNWTASHDNRLCRQSVITSDSFGKLPTWQLQVDDMVLTPDLGLAESMELFNDDYHLISDRGCISYDTSQSIQGVLLDGHVVFDSKRLHCQSRKAVLDTVAKTTQLDDSAFSIRFGEQDDESFVLWGKAEQSLIAQQQTQFDHVEVTSCQPDSIAWSLRANQAIWHDLNQSLDLISPVLNLGGIPVLSIPYISFSRQRESGLLKPIIQLHYKGDSQFVYGQPVYFNWMPNQDMLWTPYFYQDRQFRLDLVYRALLEQGRVFFSAQWLPNDRLFQSSIRDMEYDQSSAIESAIINQLERQGHNRYHVMFHYDGVLDNHWKLQMQWRNLSDVLFLEDFKRYLYPTSLPGYEDILVTDSAFYIEKFIRLIGDYDKTHWFIESQRFQELLSLNRHYIDKLYSRFINMQVKHRVSDDWLIEMYITQFGLSAGIVQSVDDIPVGWRFYYHQTNSMQFDDFYARHTLNLIHNTTDTNGQHDRQTRLIPQLNVGFQTSWSDNLSIQSEYQFTPYIQQSDLPNFDTSLKYFSFETLHDNNRFEGLDRVADVNQVNFEAQWLLTPGTNLRIGQRFALKYHKLCLNDSCTGDWLANHHVSPTLFGVSVALNQALSAKALMSYHLVEHQWFNKQFSLDYVAKRLTLSTYYQLWYDALLNDPMNGSTELFKKRLLGLSGSIQVNQNLELSGMVEKRVFSNRFNGYEVNMVYRDCCWTAELAVGKSSDGDSQTVRPFKNHYVVLKLGIPQILDAIT